MVSASPGKTGEAKRPSMCLKRSASPAHKAFNKPRPVKPYVQRPCKMGFGNTPAATAGWLGSECNGLRSPLRRYKSAWSGEVWNVTSWSALRAGGSFCVPLGPRSPPKSVPTQEMHMRPDTRNQTMAPHILGSLFSCLKEPWYLSLFHSMHKMVQDLSKCFRLITILNSFATSNNLVSNLKKTSRKTRNSPVERVRCTEPYPLTNFSTFTGRSPPFSVGIRCI